jgi:RHS repeat-associated protein
MSQSAYLGATTSYAVNGYGSRVKKVGPFGTRYFVYDDSGHMLGEYGEGGAPIQELIWFGDTLVAVKTFGATPSLYYIWTDHIDTPRTVTTQANQAVWSWDPLPFGETAPNQDPSGLGLFVFNHRFAGQYFDQETGLFQNGRREYFPEIGRYLQSDPMGVLAGVATYSFANNRPVTLGDPTGMGPCITFGGGAASFFSDLYAGIAHAVEGSGLLGADKKRCARQLEQNLAANASLFAEALSDANFRTNILYAAGLAIDEGGQAILGRMLVAAAATWATGNAAGAVIALTGGLLERIGGIDPNTFGRGIEALRTRQVTPESIEVVRQIASIAAGGC